MKLTNQINNLGFNIGLLSSNIASANLKGFNGVEKDDEVKGHKGTYYDLGFRSYDPRIARMFSIDPRKSEYPWQSSYVYHRNSPVNNLDYLGGGDGPGDPPDDFSGEAGGNTFGQNEIFIDGYFDLMLDAVDGSIDKLLDFWEKGKNGWLNKEDPNEYQFGIAMVQFSLYSLKNHALKDEFNGAPVEYVYDVGYNPFNEPNSRSSESNLRIDLSLPKADQVYDINKAVVYLTLNANESSTGYCAQYVRKSFEEGGITTNGRPRSAKDYDTYLLNKGFLPINPMNYTPVKGDVIVWEGGKHSDHGHIQMYNGKQWISDFRQKSMYPYRNKDIPHTILRR